MQALGAYIYSAQILDIHDGDTMRVLVDLGFSVHVKMDLRLAGYNAPEINTLEGVRARQTLVDMLKGISTITIQTLKTGTGKDVRSFARYVGIAHSPKVSNTMSINDMMKKALMI